MANILVIDDEASILHAFRRAFGDPDDILLTAADAAEGLELVAQHRPDVVVLDINLPDLSGLDVFHQHPDDRRAHPGHLHHRPRHDRNGDRGDEAGRLRLPAQAAGSAAAPRTGRAGLRDQPADARARPWSRTRRRGRAAADVLVGRCAGDAGGLQGDRPGRAAGRRPC